MGRATDSSPWTLSDPLLRRTMITSYQKLVFVLLWSATHTEHTAHRQSN